MEFILKGTKHRLYGSEASRPKKKESQHENDLDHHQIKEISPECTYHINIHKDPKLKENAKFSFEDKASLKEGGNVTNINNK